MGRGEGGREGGGRELNGKGKEEELRGREKGGGRG